jgi:hypothetical protein
VPTTPRARRLNNTVAMAGQDTSSYPDDDEPAAKARAEAERSRLQQGVVRVLACSIGCLAPLPAAALRGPADRVAEGPDRPSEGVRDCVHCALAAAARPLSLVAAAAERRGGRGGSGSAGPRAAAGRRGSAAGSGPSERDRRLLLGQHRCVVPTSPLPSDCSGACDARTRQTRCRRRIGRCCRCRR